MRKLRVGIIGLGRVAEVHLRGYQDVAQIEVVAAAEPRPDRRAQMAASWGFRGYADYEEMLGKEDLDIVCVLTPASLHRKATEAAAGRGVHVLCEKPMTLTVADAQAMIDCCNAAGVKLYYGSSYRHLPACRKAREMIHQGAIGDPLLLLETFIGGHGLAGWRPLGEHHYPAGGPGGSGMGLMDHGIHLADVLPWLAGSEASWVFGRGNIAGRQPGAEFMTMQLRNGAVGQLVYCEATYPSDLPTEGIFGWGLNYRPDDSLSSKAGWEDQPGNIRIHGANGALRLYHYANRLFYSTHEGCEEVRVADRPHPANFALQMESFANSILAGGEPEVTGEDGLRALRVVLAAYESARTGKSISVHADTRED